MNASYQASLVNRHIRRFTGWSLANIVATEVLGTHISSAHFLRLLPPRHLYASNVTRCGRCGMDRLDSEDSGNRVHTSEFSLNVRIFLTWADRPTATAGTLFSIFWTRIPIGKFAMVSPRSLSLRLTDRDAFQHLISVANTTGKKQTTPFCRQTKISHIQFKISG